MGKTWSRIAACLGWLVLSSTVSMAQVPPLTPAQSPLAPIDALAAAVQSRVETLRNARDLTVDAMQRNAAELEARVVALDDYAAPYPSLAEVMPRMREELSALLHDAQLGTNADVAADADSLLPEVEDFRNRVRNMAQP